MNPLSTECLGESCSWCLTQRWRPSHIPKLHCIFRNDQQTTPRTDLRLPPGHAVPRVALVNVSRLERPPTTLTPDQLVFYNRLCRTLSTGDASDMILLDMLTALDFESQILHFRSRPQLRVSIGTHHLVSSADFVVFTGENEWHSCFLVARTIPVTADSAWIHEEARLFGDMLIAALSRFEHVSHVNMDHIQPADQVIAVYGILLIGLNLRMYIAKFSPLYLQCLLLEKPIASTASVSRFPSNERSPFALQNRKDRLAVVHHLRVIHDNIESMVAEDESDTVYSEGIIDAE